MSQRLPSELRNIAFQAMRIGLLLVLAWGMRCLTTQRIANHSAKAAWNQVTIEKLTSHLPSVVRIDPPASTEALAVAKDESGNIVGHLALTLPQADRVVGYRGPSNAILIFDATAKNLVGVELLESRDTPEHVMHVKSNQEFFRQFRDWTWNVQPTEIDGVSGATLTSLAIAEGVVVRLGGQKPTLRFPNEIDLIEVQSSFPAANELKSEGNAYAILDGQSRRLGWALRTGPLVDSLEGYQGPTEILMVFDENDRLTSGKIRSSFDNEPYVGYVRDESSFWKRFRGMSLTELSQFDREVAGVDGVSGATMTSQTVIDTMVEAAKIHLSNQQMSGKTTKGQSSVRWSWHDIGTALVIAFALIASSTRLRGQRIFKVVWPIVLFLYLGLCTGNLVSQALLVGWASAGIPWKLAPGLVALTSVALIWPPLSKHNVYCHHLCPHGAAQQMLRGRLKPWKLSARWSSKLSWIPGILLVIIVVATIADWKFNAANLEPFNAYIWSIAGAASLSIALFSLLVSSKIPMAYCRFGCPTGRLIEYARRTRTSGKVTWQDCLVALIVAMVWLVYFVQRTS